MNNLTPDEKAVIYYLMHHVNSNLKFIPGYKEYNVNLFVSLTESEKKALESALEKL